MGLLFYLLLLQGKCIEGLSQRQYVFNISEQCSPAELRFLPLCVIGLTCALIP